MVTLLDKIMLVLAENYLTLNDVRVFANANPRSTLSGTYCELSNPLPQLLNSFERYQVIFVKGFNTINWDKDSCKTDILAIGKDDWLIWAKDTVICPYCHQIMPRA